MVSTGTESHTNADDLSGGAKRKRSGRACDRCHRNASRCSPGVEGTVCSRCEDQQVQCTYNRPVKRRGPPARRTRKNAITNAMTAEDDPPANTQTTAMTESINISPLMGIQAIQSMPPAIFTPEDGNSAPSPHASILYSEIEEVLEPKIIEKLVDLFYHTIYPIRPYFHWPTFDSQIRQQLYRSDWGVFIVTMACYAAAVKAMPADITTISDYCQAMKASALLTSVCLQNGNLKRLVAHLSDYICLSTMHKFHLEAHWPEGLTEIERQERRRLFWCVYQQERYLSKNFDLPTRQCEGKSTVLYPAEVFDDSDITATGVHLRPDRVSFIRGWNFCTDMYRLLENMDRLERVRQDVQSDEPGSLTDSFLARMSVPKDFVSDSLHLISKMHADLPPQLKTVQNLTGDPQTDRYRFVGKKYPILIVQKSKDLGY
ncbi:hypothetical protein N7528_004897 [Penicillium herquei]|nr:hypothetical protein N7528_004897 [Penicillium herquei]